MPPESAALGLTEPETRFLFGEAGALDAPIRAVLFGAARFADHGRSLARAQRVAPPGEVRASFFPRLRENIDTLRSARHLLEAHAGQGHHVAPAASWLVEHGDLLDQQLRSVQRALPRRYFARLPRLHDEPLAGLPRVYGIAWAWVAHTDSGVDEALLGTFLQAYQSYSPLTIGELWAIPTTLRVVLVENLRRLAERAAAVQAARHAAHRWIESAAPIDRVALLHELAGALQRRGLLEPFALQLQRRADEWPAPGADAARELVAKHLPDPAGALQRRHQQEAEDHQSVRNAVTALRGLDHIAWREVFMRSSPTLAALLRLRVFAAESRTTQDLTLHAIERLAEQRRLAEPSIAAAVVRLADGGSGRDAAPLHWLEGEGRLRLLAELGVAHAGLGHSFGRAWRRVRTPLYLATVALGTAGLVYAYAPNDLRWPAIVALLLLVLPASELVIALLHRLLSESVPPRPRARLALEHGIGEAQRTLVVVPTLLGSVAAIKAGAEQLQQHYLANPERCAQFALLSDGIDAPSAVVAGDAALLRSARQTIAALNRAHPGAAGDAPRFLLLHRERRWSPTEQRWIGWERKRGKLEQLICWLVEGGASPFVDLGPLSTPAAGVRTIVTLDSDTGMPPGRLRDLVAIAAHPLNTPEFEPGTRRVISGYTILQPRITVPLPQPGQVTPFFWMFSGKWGVDPYSAASSEIYEDVFEEGSFSGKGLIDVAAAYRTLAHRLPEGQVLSHDLLEGALSRCSAVSDVTFVEDVPAHPDVAASRLHRWTRGDWQLLPFLLAPGHWPMAGINRWKLFDNLRRSLVAPAAAALLLWVLASGTLPIGATLALIVAAYGAGPLIGALAALAPHRDELALGPYLRHSLREMLRALAGTLWQLAWLLTQALHNLDAIARALWRQAVTRRHLLQWTTAAAATAAARSDLRSLVRSHAAPAALALLLLAALAGLRHIGWPVHLPWAVALCALWALTPLWVWLASRRFAAGAERLSDADREFVRALAADTWRYYERHVGAADHFLPPDNVQLAPQLMVAHRTSPTNIGLYLLAAAAARELGFISVTELVVRLERTLDSVEALPRWRGHLYNWYDTETREVLPPAYVSTVDSGNFSGHLLVLSAACDELAAASEQQPSSEAQGLGQRLHALAARTRTLALQAQFRPLYDSRRRLFHIGLRVDGEQLDVSHYDLLASEARLASLVAIAKGDVPPRHWAALARPVFALAGRVGLKSWSGSMFEYLMPSLVLNEPAGSLLYEATRAAVLAQREDAAAHGTPWGMSESAVAVRDHTLAYQYGPQGVARLALRRTPAHERVIAPYASAMALLVAPQAAVDNLRALQALGVRRELGFIEALDYSPQRAPAHGGTAFVSVETFMAHHQAMTLLACAQLLSGGAVQRWSAQQPHLRAVQPLLHEPSPHQAEALPEPPPALPQQPAQRQRWQLDIEPLFGPAPPAHLLGNGRYGVLLRANGAGYSQWQGHGLTRWRDDSLRDMHGLFAYLRRDARAPWVSLAARPAADEAARYRTEFHPDRVVLRTQWSDLQARVTVFVSPEDDCELRRVELHNTGRHELRLTLAMAFEATLAPQRADEAHPAFSNLFVQARWAAHDCAMYLLRKPRLADEPAVHAVHFLATCDDPDAVVGAHADRSHWLGRLGSAATPDFAVVDGAATPEGELPTGLDPASIITVQLRIGAGMRRSLSFALACAPDADALFSLVDRYRHPTGAARALELSETLARIRLRELRLDPESWSAWLTLNSLLASASTRPLAQPAAQVDRKLLWRHGIAGDRPLLLLWLPGADGVAVAARLASMLPLWTAAGLALDLVIVNAEPVSYLPPAQQGLAPIVEQVARHEDAQVPESRRARLHVLRARELSPDETATLGALARVALNADGRSLSQLVERLLAGHGEDFTRRERVRRHALRWPAVSRDARAPEGAFDEHAAYRFEVGQRRLPSRPWINVLANAGFGCQVSEAAAGFCWAGNSRLRQITAWSNDALCDPPSELLLLHDVDSATVWPLGRGFGSAAREVAHGIGSTTMRETIDGLQIELCWCVDSALPIKQLQVRISSESGAPRRLRLVAFAEWTLGGARFDRGSLLTDAHRFDAGGSAALVLLASQSDAGAMPAGSSAFLGWRTTAGQHAAQADLDDWSCDRREFFDTRGRWVLPERLNQRSGGGLDACAALACRLQVSPRQPVEASVLLGFADSVDAAQQLAEQAWRVAPAERLRGQIAQWPALLDGIRVHSPDPAFDALVNRWLPYQSIACRLWARAGFYQAGGAFGFRDQLQDAMGVADRAPQLLREQIVLHAAHQFEEGDVQHWWHPPGGAGVRTHISDDLLWLPLALAHHLARQGDDALLDQCVPFLDGPPVPEGREDLYNVPAVSQRQATIYEHAARAIDHSLKTGAHGLPLMGSGDWNDGMNRVGHLGRGESVWLGWFLCHVIDRFAPWADKRGDVERAGRWRAARGALAAALDESGWDGRWYRRAYFDDGSPLGSAANPECRIDLIAQAWAVLSGAGEAERARTAMASADQLLWDGSAGVMRLLDPPLTDARPEAGYIQAYPAGIRENGGQYNHAAAWALMALAQLGDAEGAWRLFTALSPAHRSADPHIGPRYGLEPYVAAGDIYSQPPYAGHGGWSWYTGSAAWLQRAALESICGLTIEGRIATLHPCLPAHWPKVELVVQRNGRAVRISVCRDATVAAAERARHGPSRSVAIGEAVDLDACADDTRLIVLMHGGAQPLAGPTARRADTAA